MWVKCARQRKSSGTLDEKIIFGEMISEVHAEVVKQKAPNIGGFFVDR